VSTWRILSSTPGEVDTAHRATDGGRVATVHLPNRQAPADADFEQAMRFATAKWKAKL
jgi:hypothetical protein